MIKYFDTDPGFVTTSDSCGYDAFRYATGYKTTLDEFEHMVQHKAPFDTSDFKRVAKKYSINIVVLQENVCFIEHFAPNSSDYFTIVHTGTIPGYNDNDHFVVGTVKQLNKLTTFAVVEDRIKLS